MDALASCLPYILACVLVNNVLPCTARRECNHKIKNSTPINSTVNVAKYTVVTSKSRNGTCSSVLSLASYYDK